MKFKFIFTKNIYIDQRPGADQQKYTMRKVGRFLWLEQNISYPVTGSSCHASGVSTLKCVKLGRLYS